MHVNEETLRKRIAENIAYYRKQSGDTQAELAEKLNYSDKSVSKWERGEGTPDVYILSQIAELYDITVQDLLREKKVQKTRTKHLLITLMAVGLAWLVMTVLFCAAQIFNVLPEYAWLLFIYGIPVMGIVCQVFSALWWGRIAQMLSCSLILWGIGLSLVLSFQQDSVILLFAICAVVEVLIILFYILKIQMRWREMREKRRKDSEE